MSYVTRAQLIDRFGREEICALTDKIGAGDIDDGVLDAAIADAAAFIDAKLAGRYELPLASVPMLLVRIAGDIARYYLYDDQAPEQIAERYQDAVKNLERINSGRDSLGLDASGGPAKPADGAEMRSGGRIFGRDPDGNGGFL